MRKLLVVIAILVVAAVAVVALDRWGDSTKQVDGGDPCKTELATLETAIEAYQRTRERMPTSSADLVAANYISNHYRHQYAVTARGTIVLTEYGRDEGCLVNYPPR